MNRKTALGTIESLIEARKNKDFEAAFSCYERNATVVLQPGKTGKGEEVIKSFIEQASYLSLIFQGHEMIETENIALHLSQYTLDLGENGIINGRTADVLNKQPDGTWLIAIDNAWAANDLSEKT
jgi:ketosteroid isomerase-like protein